MGINTVNFSEATRSRNVFIKASSSGNVFIMGIDIVNCSRARLSIITIDAFYGGY